MFHKMRSKTTDSNEPGNLTFFLIFKLKTFFFQCNLGMAVGRRLACPKSEQMVPV